MRKNHRAETKTPRGIVTGKDGKNRELRFRETRPDRTKPRSIPFEGDKGKRNQTDRGHGLIDRFGETVRIDSLTHRVIFRSIRKNGNTPVSRKTLRKRINSGVLLDSPDIRRRKERKRNKKTQFKPLPLPKPVSQRDWLASRYPERFARTRETVTEVKPTIRTKYVNGVRTIMIGD